MDDKVLIVQPFLPLGDCSDEFIESITALKQYGAKLFGPICQTIKASNVLLAGISPIFKSHVSDKLMMDYQNMGLYPIFLSQPTYKFFNSLHNKQLLMKIETDEGNYVPFDLSDKSSSMEEKQANKESIDLYINHILNIIEKNKEIKLIYIIGSFPSILPRKIRSAAKDIGIAVDFCIPSPEVYRELNMYEDKYLINSLSAVNTIIYDDKPIYEKALSILNDISNSYKDVERELFNQCIYGNQQIIYNPSIWPSILFTAPMGPVGALLKFSEELVKSISDDDSRIILAFITKEDYQSSMKTMQVLNEMIERLNSSKTNDSPKKYVVVLFSLCEKKIVDTKYNTSYKTTFINACTPYIEDHKDFYDACTSASVVHFCACFEYLQTKLFPRAILGLFLPPYYYGCFLAKSYIRYQKTKYFPIVWSEPIYRRLGLSTPEALYHGKETNQNAAKQLLNLIELEHKSLLKIYHCSYDPIIYFKLESVMWYRITPKEMNMDQNSDNNIIDPQNKVYQCIKSNLSTLKRRLILLDYDGTLTPIVATPSDAILSESHKQSIVNLCQNTKNIVYIISGRDTSFMEEQVGHILNLGICCEHGALFRHHNKRIWEKPKNILPVDLMKAIKDHMMKLSEICPGSFVETKETSVVWHYRKCNMDDIDKYVEKIVSHANKEAAQFKANISIIKGKKVVEVLFTKYRKSDGVKNIINRLQLKQFNLVLCAGDDKTDEEMFNALNEIKSADVDISILLTCLLSESANIDTTAQEILPSIDSLYSIIDLLS